MPERALLDTNAAIAYLNGDLGVQRAIRSLDQGCLCPAVIGELVYGAMRSRKIESNLENLHRFMRFFMLLPCTEATAMHYGRLRGTLANVGRPIPNNDVWIAAAAVEHSLAIVTRDAHFHAIEGLDLITW